jgi:hypothetical protein
MKTKNQTEPSLLESAAAKAKAANEDGISPSTARENSAPRKQAWSPAEVWRTRVKTPTPINRKDTAQIQG